MGKRSRQFEEEERFVRCHVCYEDIAIEFYLERGDVVYCQECDSEYILKSKNPTRIALLYNDTDEYNDFFFDDYSSNGYE